MLCGSDPLIQADTPLDFDGDGQCNGQDQDDDEDGWGDVDEQICGTDPLARARAE